MTPADRPHADGSGADRPGTLLAPAAFLPALPPSIPRRHDPRWLHALARWVLRRWTWTGGFPDRDRLVVIAWPHTSNSDGLIGLASLVVLGLDLRALGKQQLFWPPLGGVLRYLGVMPVDREAPGGMVGRAVAQFAEGQPLVLGLAPEGTRRRTEAWRTGWHRIAVEAGVPVAIVGLDWGRRRLGIVGTFVPTGDYATDAQTAERLLDGVVGRHPSSATPALGQATLGQPTLG